MSFFAELKRRNVFRVGIAYAVATWILLQLTEVMSEILVLPEWAPKLILLILIIGFIPALIFAWAFELTPEGVKREKDVDRSQSITPQTGRKLDFAIIGLLAVGLVYFIWEARFAEPAAEPTQPAISASRQASGEPTGETEAEVNRQSIAVLPFDNRSDQESDRFFVEGVHDDLLTNLARIKALKVISRTSVKLYEGSEKSLPEIAEELGVATIMEGAVQRAGDTVRINVQLIDAQTDEHLWAEIFDRKMTAENLFAIQSEISEKIADALEATLTDAERDRINTMPTDDLEAYDAYVRGRQHMATRESGRLEEATEEFKRAVELDPEFALAWVGVADSHKLLNIYGTLDFNEALAIREEAINMALEIDPNLGEAWTSQADFYEDKRDFGKSEEAFRKAIELSPNYATAYHWYAIALGRYPLRSQERTDVARRAAELDPRSSIVGVALAGAYLEQGLWSRAERQYLKVLDLEPGFANGMANLAGLYITMGRYADAMKYARKASELDPGNPGFLHGQAFTYLHLGEPDKAEELLERLEELNPERPGNGFISMWANLVRGNDAGAREAANWTITRMRRFGQPLTFFGNMEVMLGNPAKAREFYLESDPGWLEPERWPELIGRTQFAGCIFSWILMQTGDEELGGQLLDVTTKYLTEELPAAIEHADSEGPELCLVLQGDFEAALTVIETQMDHNHITAFWNTWFRFPMFEPIRHEERLHAAIAENERRLDEQRELVRQMDEGLTL